jgi:putative transposase
MQNGNLICYEWVLSTIIRCNCQGGTTKVQCTSKVHCTLVCKLKFLEKRMPTTRPDYFPGGFYHFYNRGSHRESIFCEPDNYLFVLRRIKQYQAELNITVLAYCLMPNHYHLLVRQDGDQPAGLLPQRVFNSYSKAYNKNYQHSGTLFEGPYRVKPVVQTSHLLQLCRYIHGNPVKDCLVKDPADWPYSNYLEWMGQRNGTLVDRGFISQNFLSIGNYSDFVNDYLTSFELPPNVTSHIEKLER